MVPNRARSTAQFTLKTVPFSFSTLARLPAIIPPPVMLYNQLAISLLFDDLPIVIVLSQRHRQKETLLRAKPILKSQSTLELAHHNGHIAGFVEDHGLRVEEDRGHEQDKHGKESAHVALILVTAVIGMIDVPCGLLSVLI